MSVPDPPDVCVSCWKFRPTLTEGFVKGATGFFGHPINICRECMLERVTRKSEVEREARSMPV